METIKDFLESLQKTKETCEKSGFGQSKIKWESAKYDVRFASKKEASKWFKETILGN